MSSECPNCVPLGSARSPRSRGSRASARRPAFGPELQKFGQAIDADHEPVVQLQESNEREGYTFSGDADGRRHAQLLHDQRQGPSVHGDGANVGRRGPSHPLHRLAIGRVVPVGWPDDMPDDPEFGRLEGLPFEQFIDLVRRVPILDVKPEG